nr:CAP domain-containing protein [Paenibacillus mesophilus]
MFIVAVLLLVIGCSSQNNVTKKQVTPKQTKVEAPSRSAAPMSNLTQASSISTPNAGTMSITQAPDGSWMDWFQGITVPAPTPAPTPTTTPTPAPGQYPAYPPANPQQSADTSQYAQQVLDLVNQERSKAGLQPLSMNSSLSNVAMAKAQDMYNNNYFDHQSPTYGSPFDMMQKYGITYNTAGENIAKGQRSPTEVMNQWMNSPGHRANILNSSFTQIGIAYYNSEWVQEFIG